MNNQNSAGIRIAFVGNAGSGKDLCSALTKRFLFATANECKCSAIASLDTVLHSTDAYLCEHSLNKATNFCAILRFADPLKHYIALVEQQQFETTLKESFKSSKASNAFAKSELANFSIREAHLKMSDALKQVFGQQHFVRYVENVLQSKSNNANIIVADCRYPAEAHMLKEHGFLLVKVVNTSNAVQHINHSSENLIDLIECDASIDNDGKSIVKLAKQVNDMLIEKFACVIDSKGWGQAALKLQNMDASGMFK